ncbi:hypothetical protein NP493_1984g00021 [Ridgeia piscesae]|uniref:Uncharacterized protein n=1 Tax=Ridgeia piscesae TaxID=27915 RepID=A0AAD9JNI2_RIDPI|nr:hypothetical protein NP493_1984g00021 [Ridgeia piscesae]
MIIVRLSFTIAFTEIVKGKLFIVFLLLLCFLFKITRVQKIKHVVLSIIQLYNIRLNEPLYGITVIVRITRQDMHSR